MSKIKKVTEKRVYIQLPQETINYVQSIDYEAASRLNILNTLASNLGVKSSAFKEYQAEYVAFNAEYQLIKDRLMAVYVPTALQTHDVQWQLNFQTNLMEILIRCACGIKLVDSGEVVFVPNEEDDILARFNTSDDEEDEKEECSCKDGSCACGK